jgi:PAS domain S-box-containing protein
MSTAHSSLNLQRRTDEHIQGGLAILPIAAYTCDIDGRITYFNKRAEELWGRCPALNDAAERYCGSASLLTVDGARIPHEKCWTALALQSGSRYDGLAAVLLRPDGSRRNVLVYVSPLNDHSGALVGATTVLVDITDQIQQGLQRRENDASECVADITEEKAAKAALQASEANFRGFFESVAVGAVQVGKDGRFMRVNDRYCEITGYSREELLTMGPLDVDHPDDREADRERVAKFLAGIGAYRAEKRYLRKDGSVTWVRVAANLLRDANPESFHSAAIVEDISERKLAEQALQHADRLKDEFIATLAHELRNPLAPMQTAVELLRHSDPEQTQWSHGVIARQLKHLTQLVADLLDISRITSNKLQVHKEPVQLADVVQAAVESTRPILERCDQQLIVTLPAEPLCVDGDLVRLAQVLSNLLSNAAKFTEGRGVVRLTAVAAGPEIQVTVTDTGIGMSEDERVRVFDKFFQGSRRPARSFGGLGVGLSLVRQLVELHGGTIEARSAGPDRGSEFVVRLPGRSGGAAPTRTSTVGAMAAAIAAKRVLIVDDNRDGARAIARLLRTMGHEVAIAFEGCVALERARDFDPDVILLDLGMPGVDGFQVCQRLRAHAWSRRCPRIVALTGWGREGDLARTKRAGFDAHLVKPVDSETLEELLEQYPGQQA